MTTTQTVPVTERALLQRINRRLAKNGEQILKARTERARLELGDYYRIDVSRNAIVGKDERLEALGAELEVLQAYEHVVEAA
jgi:hypothetical protein